MRSRSEYSVRRTREKRRGRSDNGFVRTLTKTMHYLEVFARFKDEENIKAVERLLNSHTELEMFERSQLGESLLPSILLPQ